MRSLKNRKNLALGLFSILFLCGTALGQTITGSISGTVADSSGAVVPSVQVNLINEATKAARGTTTNSTGNFGFNSVSLGTYTIEFTKPGFEKLIRKGVSLSAAQTLALGTVTINVGEATQTVTVAAAPLAVSTSSAARTGLLTQKQLDLTPIRGRDPVNIVKVMPGVSQVVVPGGGGQANENSVQSGNQSLGAQFGSYEPNMNGLREYFNDFTLDGEAGGDVDIEGAFNEVSSVDTVAEVQAEIANYPAEYGRTGGSIVNIVTKSGTSQFHGNLYYFLRNEAFDANDFFNNRNGVNESAYRYNDFGGTIGGPVYIPGYFNTQKNKLVFFYSDDSWRIQQPSGLINATVPTQAERMGDFSHSVTQGGQLISIINPATKQPFAGNIISAGDLVQQGQALLNLTPLPNFTNTTISKGAYNYQWQDHLSVPKHNQLLRLDYHPTEKDSFFARAVRWWTDTRGYTTIVAWSGSNLPILKSHYKFTSDSLQTGWTHVLSPTAVNEFQIGLRGLKEIGAPESSNEFAPVIRSNRGITLGQLFPAANPEDFIPNLTFGGLPDAASITHDTRIPIWAGDQRLDVLDNFSFVRGSHDLKFGIYWEPNWNSEGHRSNSSNSGAFDFSVNPNNPGNTGDPFANALLGNFNSYTESNNQLLDKSYRDDLEWFGQDNWKVSRKLTLNYGMRFAYFSPWTYGPSQGASFASSRYNPDTVPPFFTPALNASGNRVAENPLTGQLLPAVYIGGFVPGSGNSANPGAGIVLATDPSYPKGFMYHNSVQLQPRFGFAYDVFGDGKTAIRGGFGVTTEDLPSASAFSFAATMNPPLQLSPEIFYGNLNTFLNSAGVLFPNNLTSVQENAKAPTVYNYSFGIQHLFGRSVLGDVAYVGNTTRHLWQTTNINELPYGARFNPANVDLTTGRSLPDSFLEPYRGYGSISYIEAAGTSNYNALQVELRTQPSSSRYPQLSLSYTYSKVMDLADSDSGGVSYYISPHVWDWGPASFDETHMLSASYVWALPKASTWWPNAFTRSALDGWEWSGVATFASGVPFGINLTTTNNEDITGGGDGARVVRTGPVDFGHGQRTFSNWFNTSMIALPAVGTVGNAPRMVFRGPGLNNWDMGVSKNFPIRSEARYLQFRCELYNAFNHTQFQTVDNTALFNPLSGQQVNGEFGQVTSTRPPRIIQLSLSLYF